MRLPSRQDSTLRLCQAMSGELLGSTTPPSIRSRAASNRKARRTWNAVGIRAPDLVGPHDGRIPQQVGIDPVLRMRHAGVRLLADRGQTHPAHQPGHPGAGNPVPQPVQVARYLPRSVTRTFQERLADPAGSPCFRQPHQRQRRRALACQPAIVARAADPGQRALPHGRGCDASIIPHLRSMLIDRKPSPKTPARHQWPISPCRRARRANGSAPPLRSHLRCKP